MSDHDEPTERAAPEPKPSLFAAVTGRRASVAFVVVALVWLGVWVYTSDSAATSSSVTTASIKPPASSPAKKGQPHGGGQSSPTTLAPPANLPRTAQAYATALFGDWMRHDRPAALRVATSKAVNHLFARRLVANEQFTAGGCKVAGSFSNCTWTSARRQVVLQVQNPAGSRPVRVVGVTIHRL